MTVKDTSRPPPASLLWRKWKTKSLLIQHFRSPFCAMTFVVLLSQVVAIPTRSQGNPAVEYQVKAAFLFNFCKIRGVALGHFSK
jgi:hypothetical protein